MFQPFLPSCSCLQGIRDLPYAAVLGQEKPCPGMMLVLPVPRPHMAPCKQGQPEGDTASSLYQLLCMSPFPTTHHDTSCLHKGHRVGISCSPGEQLLGCRRPEGSPAAAAPHCTWGWLWGSGAAPRTAIDRNSCLTVLETGDD